VVFEVVMIFVAITSAVMSTRARKFRMKSVEANTKIAREKHEKEREEQLGGTPDEGECGEEMPSSSQVEGYEGRSLNKWSFVESDYAGDRVRAAFPCCCFLKERKILNYSS
jgi:hypothetical protein